MPIGTAFIHAVKKGEGNCFIFTNTCLRKQSWKQGYLPGSWFLQLIKRSWWHLKCIFLPHLSRKHLSWVSSSLAWKVEAEDAHLHLHRVWAPRGLVCMDLLKFCMNVSHWTWPWNEVPQMIIPDANASRQQEHELHRLFRTNKLGWRGVLWCFWINTWGNQNGSLSGNVISSEESPLP